MTSVFIQFVQKNTAHFDHMFDLIGGKPFDLKGVKKWYSG